MTHCLNISDSEAVLVDGAADNLEAIYDVREEILKAGKRILVDDPDCQLPNEHFERFTDLGLGFKPFSWVITRGDFIIYAFDYPSSNARQFVRIKVTNVI